MKFLTLAVSLLLTTQTFARTQEKCQERAQEKQTKGYFVNGSCFLENKEFQDKWSKKIGKLLEIEQKYGDEAYGPGFVSNITLLESPLGLDWIDTKDVETLIQLPYTVFPTDDYIAEFPVLEAYKTFKKVNGADFEGWTKDKLLDADYYLALSSEMPDAAKDYSTREEIRNSIHLDVFYLMTSGDGGGEVTVGRVSESDEHASREYYVAFKGNHLLLIEVYYHL